MQNHGPFGYPPRPRKERARTSFVLMCMTGIIFASLSMIGAHLVTKTWQDRNAILFDPAHFCGKC